MAETLRGVLQLQGQLAGEYLVVRDGQPAAVVIPTAGHAEQVCGCLQAAGWETHLAEELIDTEGPCQIDQPRACDAKVVVNTAHDLARDAGVPSPELDSLTAKRFWSMSEVTRALEATRERLSGQNRTMVEEGIGFLKDGGSAAVDPE